MIATIVEVPWPKACEIAFHTTPRRTRPRRLEAGSPAMASPCGRGAAVTRPNDTCTGPFACAGHPPPASRYCLDRRRGAAAGEPVPKRRRRRGAVGRDPGRDLEQPVRVEPEHGVRPVAHGDRPLGVLPQREAGDAEHGRLLLHAAGVGDDRRRVGLEREEAEVRLRLDEAHRAGRDAEVVEPRPRPRVDREDDRQVAADPHERAHRAPAGARGCRRARAGGA